MNDAPHFYAKDLTCRRNTLQWIYDAKTDVTRTNRINQTIEAVKNNTRIR